MDSYGRISLIGYTFTYISTVYASIEGQGNRSSNGDTNFTNYHEFETGKFSNSWKLVKFVSKLFGTVQFDLY